jgi:hypothetical protein
MAHEPCFQSSLRLFLLFHFYRGDEAEPRSQLLLDKCSAHGKEVGVFVSAREFH